MPKQVIVYAKESGKEPFTEWLYSLRDVIVRKRSLPAFPGCNKETMEIVSRSAKGLASCDYFSVPATGFISERRITKSSSCSAVATREAKAKTLNKTKPIGRSI